MRRSDEIPEGLTGLLFGKYSEYITRLQPLLITCVFLFTFSLVMGYFLGPDISPTLLDELLGEFPDPSNMGVFDLFGFILINNLSKSLIFMLAGFILGLPPLIFVVLNGFFIGWVAYSFGAEYGLGFVMLALIPHGIVEIPAILLSMAVGMGLGFQLINKLRGRGSIMSDIRNAIGLFIWRIAPMIILAAILEVTITPLLISTLNLS